MSNGILNNQEATEEKMLQARLNSVDLSLENEETTQEETKVDSVLKVSTSQVSAERKREIDTQLDMIAN